MEFEIKFLHGVESNFFSSKSCYIYVSLANERTYLVSSSLTMFSLTSLKLVAFMTDDDVDPLPSTALLNSSFISSFPKPSELTKIPPAVDFASDVTISVLTPFGVFVIVTFTNVVLTGGCIDD